MKAIRNQVILQAEDGIRDSSVTGVQTCALPIYIICSTTMRHDQAGFLHMHERAGYSVRGSVCYKRLNYEQ